MKILCNHCGYEGPPILTHKIVPVQEHLRRDPRMPKYTVMVKGSCMKCKQYIKFVKQTPEVIDTINEHLKMTELKLTSANDKS